MFRKKAFDIIPSWTIIRRIIFYLNSKKDKLFYIRNTTELNYEEFFMIRNNKKKRKENRYICSMIRRKKKIL
jgi:hypothetical protein